MNKHEDKWVGGVDIHLTTGEKFWLIVVLACALLAFAWLVCGLGVVAWFIWTLASR